VATSIKGPLFLARYSHRINFKKKPVLNHSVGQTLEQAAQGGAGVPIPGGV